MILASLTTPVLAERTTLVLYRLCAAKLGFATGSDGTILHCEPAANTADAGLQEGDRVLSVDGTPFEPNSKSMWLAMLERKPGDLMRVVWLREGVGRMEGELKCVPNGPSLDQVAESLGRKSRSPATPVTPR